MTRTDHGRVGGGLCMSYLYNDSGYRFLSLHRKVLEYDPRNTDNLIILDYFNTMRRNRDDVSVYYKLIESEINQYQTGTIPDSPISFQMVWHEINMAWVDIIHQMIFIDQVYDTFHGEYKNVVEDIILHDTLDEKETLVYRYCKTGESPFHIAGKMWLYGKWIEVKRNGRGETIDKDLRFILSCYENFEKRFGSNRKFCILYLMDFSGKTLVDYLTDFLDELQNPNW